MRYSLLVLVAALAGCAGPRGPLDSDAGTEPLLQRAVAAYRQGKIVEAHQAATQGAREDAENAQFQNLLGLTSQRLDRPEAAREHFRRALQLAPQDALILNNYGTFLCERREFKDAQTQFLLAAQAPGNRNPDVAYVNAGLCALRAGQPDSARGFLEQAIQQKPNQSVALFQLARLYFDQGQVGLAESYLNRYLQVATHNAQTLLLGAEIEHRNRRTAGLQDYVAKLESAYPNSAEAKRAQRLLQPAAPGIFDPEREGLLDEQWIMGRAPRHYTIQILSAADLGTFQSHVGKLPRRDPAAYFTQRRNNETRYNLIVGDYADIAQATAALEALPPALRAVRPWVRNFADLQNFIKPPVASSPVP